MDGYVLFRKDRLARQGGGAALYVREQLECTELHLGGNDEEVKSLWISIRGWANIGDTVVDVYYRPPDQDEEVDEAFYKQLEESLTIPSTGSNGGLQPSCYLLAKQHIQAHKVYAAPAIR